MVLSTQNRIEWSAMPMHACVSKNKNKIGNGYKNGISGPRLYTILHKNFDDEMSSCSLAYSHVNQFSPLQQLSARRVGKVRFISSFSKRCEMMNCLSIYSFYTHSGMYVSFVFYATVSFTGSKLDLIIFLFCTLGLVCLQVLQSLTRFF